MKRLTRRDFVGFASITPLFAFAGAIAVSDALTSETDATAGEPMETPRITFSVDSGSFEEPFDLELAGPDGWSIHYSVDGSIPTANSPRYSAPIPIADLIGKPNTLASEENIALMYVENTAAYYVPSPDQVLKANVIRAVAISPDGESQTQVETRTYLVGVTYTQRYGGLPVIQIVTDPANLLDYERGIMAKGAIYDDWVQTEDAKLVFDEHRVWDVVANYTQHGRAWERDAVFELYDGTDIISTASKVGIRVRGGASRSCGQRSLNVYFREGDGLNYPVFTGLLDYQGNQVTRYDVLILRNGGNDAERTKFRDSMISELASGMNLFTQSSRLAVYFLNGEYWGILNLMNKYDDVSIAQEYGVPKKQVVVIKEGEVDEGKDEDIGLYEELLSFASRDLSDSDEWQAFLETVDISSMVDYYALEAFIANCDCMTDRNQAFWRVREPGLDGPYGDGRWRWILFDTEYSTGLYAVAETLADADTIARLIAEDALFASAMKSEVFRGLFRERLEGLAKDEFAPERFLATIERYIELYGPYIDEYSARFGYNSSLFFWYEVNNIRQFATNRAAYILAYDWEHCLAQS